ncbi:MAG: ABC transporter permease subunit [Kiritimatiellae bacterium]|nr:ABC transporter permease subunit [Kiritimatiellia bacterium]MCO5061695.1 ABC transporter permease subunit [Kiritimatiellia bacterium]MCO6401227.1 ABC transporter permease subunit [Verrucomicrobiota bacterium]
MATSKERSFRARRLFLDRLAHGVVSTSGFLIIASILAILFVIAAQVLPLLRRPTAQREPTLSSSVESPVLRTGSGEYRELFYSVTRSGVSIHRAADNTALPTGRDMDWGGATVTAVSQGLGDTFVLGLSDGRIVPATVSFSARFADGQRIVHADRVYQEAFREMGVTSIAIIAHAPTPRGQLIAIPTGPRSLRILNIEETETLLGDVSRELFRRDVEVEVKGAITALAVGHHGDLIIVGTSSGEIAEINLQDNDRTPRQSPPIRAERDARAITALGFLLGDRTLVVGTASGQVSTWQLLARDGAASLVKMHDFEPQRGSISAIAASPRNKGFVTASDEGDLYVRYGTTGRTLLKRSADEALAAVAFAPKGDGLVAGSPSGNLHRWTLNNPHPEITWKSLFGKVWYEGYNAPAYVWQSSGGTDEFEPKFSLTPLVFGTLKGTFYALLFAIPIALLGALYASQFMHPALKNLIKPVVELMAALPSVVLGFIAGIWLAPLMAQHMPALLLMPFVIAAVILAAVWAWHRAPVAARSRVRAGGELFLLAPAVLFGGWLSLQLGQAAESGLLSGDFRQWLLATFGLTFDQRNSMVVGFAMGFAVVPIIFTIAEDALAGVPPHLKAGALSLGATPWQTAVRVVLPTASPGIFSAIMIGFGRAVGETMIVLMATGNTPIMDASIFNGFRALSANIAVELPEAPEGGTLYRVLFLAALLLLAMTFVANTLAEWVRLHLRRRYQVL